MSARPMALDILFHVSLYFGHIGTQTHKDAQLAIQFFCFTGFQDVQHYLQKKA